MSQTPHAEPTISLQEEADRIILAFDFSTVEIDESLIAEQFPEADEAERARLLAKYGGQLMKVMTLTQRGQPYLVPVAFAAAGEARREQMRREEQPFIDAVQRRMEQIGPAVEAAFEAAAANGAFEEANK